MPAAAARTLPMKSASARGSGRSPPPDVEVPEQPADRLPADGLVAVHQHGHEQRGLALPRQLDQRRSVQ